MSLDVTLKDLLKLLEVLSKLNDSGIKVNKEVNIVLCKVIQRLGITDEELTVWEAYKKAFREGDSK